MLNVDGIECHYEQQLVLNGLSFCVNQGSLCCLLGPSGCGKTTALRAIAGFHAIDQGKITLHNQLLSSPTHTVEPELRHIGMVFQDYALFPHLNVQDNIRFGIQKLPSKQQQHKVDELLALIKLTDLADRYPHELSGGQQQRIALVRALAPNPKLLLLDEPFSNLDVDLRRHLNLEIRDILKQYGTSAVLVTHDQEEAFAFGDYIGLLYDGILQQWDTPFKLYHEPNNRFVANFIGQGALLPAVVLDQHHVKTELGTVHSSPPHSWATGTLLDILLRPDDIVLNNNGSITTVVKKIFSGSSTLYTLRLSTGSTVTSSLPSHYDYQVGDTITVSPEVKHFIAFSPKN